MYCFPERGWLLAASLAAALSLGTTGLHAQNRADLRTRTTRAIGWSGVLPDALVGGGAWQFFGASRIGVFADGKITLPSLGKDPNYCPPALGACTRAWVESNRPDFLLDTQDEWLLINAGGMYALTPSLAVMLGGGMARRSTYHQFIDENDSPELRITWEGNYYVPEEEVWEPQAVAGVLMRIGARVAFTFGYESAPGTMGVGAYLILP